MTPVGLIWKAIFEPLGREEADQFQLRPDFSPKSPLTYTLDWLIGQDYPYYKNDGWMGDPNDRGPNAAPILKLTSAIVSQAVSDQASRIELWTGLPAYEYQTCESPANCERRIQIENQEIASGSNSKQFARIMAEAGVMPTNPFAADPLSWLTVIYVVGGLRFAAMRVPANLADPTIRVYPFNFNYKRCATIARPENLVYVQTKQRAAFASIDHYDRSSDFKLGIALEYED